MTIVAGGDRAGSAVFGSAVAGVDRGRLDDTGSAGLAFGSPGVPPDRPGPPRRAPPDPARLDVLDGLGSPGDACRCFCLTSTAPAVAAPRSPCRRRPWRRCAAPVRRRSPPRRCRRSACRSRAAAACRRPLRRAAAAAAAPPPQPLRHRPPRRRRRLRRRRRARAAEAELGEDTPLNRRAGRSGGSPPAPSSRRAAGSGSPCSPRSSRTWRRAGPPSLARPSAASASSSLTSSQVSWRAWLDSASDDPRAHEEALDAGDRRFHRGRDLLVGHRVHLAEKEGGALGLGKLVDVLEQVAELLAVLDPVGDRGAVLHRRTSIVSWPSGTGRRRWLRQRLRAIR